MTGLGTAIANFYLIRTIIGSALLAGCLPYSMAVAQSQLPAPSRTIYKCTTGKTVTYSDEPCIGAQRLDAVPTRGVDHLSGFSRIGSDVAREIYSEQLAKAFEPISGMSPSQFATAVRRNQLPSAVQRECSHLEPVILGLEQEEKRVASGMSKLIQQNLLDARKRYKQLAC